MVFRFILAFATLFAASLAAAAGAPVEMGTNADAEVYAWIGRDGGKLEMRTEDGTEYLLDVPPGALIWPEYIAMRPVISVKGLPGKGALAGGVSFEPKGLEFAVPASLRITPAKPAGKKDVPMAWEFEGRGARPWLTVAREDGKSHVFAVASFSGVIVIREPAKSFTDLSFTDAVEAAQKAAAEGVTMWRDDTGLAEAELDAANAEDAAVKLYEDTAEMLAARNRAQIGIQRLPGDLACERARQVYGIEACPGRKDVEREKLKEDIKNGIIKSDLLEMGRPGTTCERAAEINREILGFERDWQLSGQSDPHAPAVIAPGGDFIGMVPVQIDGGIIEMSAGARTGQLCKKKALEACKQNGDVPGLIRMILGLEREKQLMGSDPSELEALTMDLAGVLECAAPAIERCYARGDFVPLRALRGAAETIAESGADLPLETIARAKAVAEETAQALAQCARYKLTWSSKSSHQSVLPGYAIGRDEVDAEYEAELSYHPGEGGLADFGGSLSGKGPARFLRCESRLVKATDFLSQAIVSPCEPASDFTAFIKEMTLGDGKLPGRLVLRGSMPIAWMTWRQCWKNVGCSEHPGASGGIHTFLTYQFGGGDAKTVGEYVAPKPIKEGAYPVLFEDTITARTKIYEGEFEDVSHIRLEHIGRR